MTRTALFLLVLLGLIAGALPAEAPHDFQIESDRFDMAESGDLGIVDNPAQYIDWLLKQGYPIHSIMLHAVARGMSISDVAYLLTQADPAHATEIYGDAIDLLPQLPGWTCETKDGLTGRYAPRYKLADLGAKPTVREVAKRFFEDGARLSPTPRWHEGESSMSASIDELISISGRAQGQGATGNRRLWWYEPGELAPGQDAPLFVSLYPKDKSIAVDASPVRLEQMKQRGVSSVPIVFVYNSAEYIPVSGVDRGVPGKSTGQRPNPYIHYGDGKVTASEVIDNFLRTGEKVTPVREWRIEDHHVTVDSQELGSLFHLPGKQDVPPAQWQRLTHELKAHGFARPLQVTVSGDSGKKWLDDPDKAAVAADLGMQTPVIFLMHNIRRAPCGLPTACQESVCQAVRAGGGGPSACQPKSGAPATAPAVRPEGSASPS